MVKLQLQVEQQSDHQEVAEVVFEEEEDIAEMGEVVSRDIKTEPETEQHPLIDSVEQG